MAGFGKGTIRDFGLTGSSSDVIEFFYDLFDDVADVMSHATQVARTFSLRGTPIQR